MRPHLSFHLTSEQTLLMVFAAALLIVFCLPQYFSTGWTTLQRLLRLFRPINSGIRVGPAYLSDDSRLRHTHIVGATGTGKTILIEKLLFEDLRRGGGAIIIDPKGERLFYNSVKSLCREIDREKDLHLLSATHSQESSVWNPCALGSSSELQTKFFNSSVYSEPHYAKACEYGLLKAFRELKSREGTFTVTDLIAVLEEIGAHDKNETLQGLYFDLSNLIYGEWEKVLTSSEGDSRTPLDLLRLIQNNQILFVDLPTEGKRVQSSRIGRLLTQEIILISGMRKRQPSLKGSRPFSVFIDEFDAFATESFATFLNKGRSSDFMIHLAHQTLSDLNIISPEFSGQIMGNCNNRFIFRQDDPDDAERWARFIGTKKVVKRTFKTEGGMETGDASNRETQEFIISPDTIKSLPVGKCVFNSKTTNHSQIIRIPFSKKNTASKDVHPLPPFEPARETAIPKPAPRRERLRTPLQMKTFLKVDPKKPSGVMK